jgi:hypothetical protein
MVFDLIRGLIEILVPFTALQKVQTAQSRSLNS